MKSVGGFWPDPRLSQQTHIFITSRGTYRVVNYASSARQTCGCEQYRRDVWKQQRQRRILMTKSILGWNKSHWMMLCDPLVLCKNTYASMLRAFCGEGLSNLGSVLTVILDLRNIFLRCQSTDRCDLCIKCCCNVSQSHTLDRNASLSTAVISSLVTKHAVSINIASRHLACKLLRECSGSPIFLYFCPAMDKKFQKTSQVHHDTSKRKCAPTGLFA